MITTVDTPAPGLADAIEHLERVAAGPKENVTKRGPVLKPASARKKARIQAKKSRKRNR